jgi:eukaryotic-like serine/threonine-protein kinase
VRSAASGSIDPSALRGLPRKGDRIGDRYRVENLVGLGGMGAVVSAMHMDLQQRVAIKIMLPRGARHAKAISRFLREARAASAIQSEHVVRTHDVGRLKNGLPYLVMEYLTGASLEDVLTREGPLPVGVAVHYVMQACEAVSLAHAAGIVHRDLKPANLYLTTRADGSPLVKVLDFGISKAEWLVESAANPALTATTDTIGTPTYMSPEQVRSAKNVDWRTDVWSMGAVLYELITGEAPFWADNLTALAAIIVSDPVVPPSERRKGVPKEIDPIILQCLSKDPPQRPADIPALARLLEPFVPPAARYVFDRVTRIGPPNSAMTTSTEAPPELDLSTWSSHDTAQGWGTTAHESVSRKRVLIATAASVSAAVTLVGLGLFFVLREGVPGEKPSAASAAPSLSAPISERPEATAGASASGPVRPAASALAPGPSGSASSAPSAPKPPKRGPRVDPFDERY